MHATPALAGVLLLAVAVTGQDLSTFEAPDGGYNAYATTFTVTVSGVTTPSADCQIAGGQLPLACLSTMGNPTWEDGDYVTISYTAVNVSSAATSLDIRMCYSAVDVVDRPWRKVGSDVAANQKGQCKYKVGTVDSVANGEIKWTLPSTTPNAQLFPRVFVMCGEETCGMGNSPPTNPYLVQTQKMDTTPPGLVTAVAICASTGPLILAGYVAYQCIKAKDD